VSPTSQGGTQLQAQHRADVLIIGAGPAGLTLGRELQERGVSFCLIERGTGAGESWRRMPVHLKLVSPWKASRLPGGPRRGWARHRVISRAEYLDYLCEYARALGPALHTGTEVKSVRCDAPGRFHVQTTQGVYSGRLVVNATGYFQNPFWPRLTGGSLDHNMVEQRSSIPCLHSADYGSPEAVARRLGRTGGRILIVGHRLSAGQLIEEFADAGYALALSHRSPLQFGSGPIGWWIFFRIHPWIEALKLFWSGPAARGFEVRMPGGRPRQLIERGAVELFPAITRLSGDQVHFTNGAVLQPDAIVLATGYRPALGHLQDQGPGLTFDAKTGRPPLREMESVEVPGLYFLGLDHSRNFQSRFLRGLRRDAVLLAQRLAQALVD
jgi:putative flavoprotein involved in K+ transport